MSNWGIILVFFLSLIDFHRYYFYLIILNGRQLAIVEKLKLRESVDNNVCKRHVIIIRWSSWPGRSARIKCIPSTDNIYIWTNKYFTILGVSLYKGHIRMSNAVVLDSTKKSISFRLLKIIYSFVRRRQSCVFERYCRKAVTHEWFGILAPGSLFSNLPHSYVFFQFIIVIFWNNILKTCVYIAYNRLT